MHPNGGAIGEDGGPLEGVSEFSDIPAPLRVEEMLFDRRVQLESGLAELSGNARKQNVRFPPKSGQFNYATSGSDGALPRGPAYSKLRSFRFS